jgi:hypothetical protein
MLGLIPVAFERGLHFVPSGIVIGCPPGGVFISIHSMFVLGFIVCCISHLPRRARKNPIKARIPIAKPAVL